MSSHLDPSVNSTLRYAVKWLKPLQRGTLSALLLVMSDTSQQNRKKGCVHFVNQSTRFPTQHPNMCLKATPEMMSEHSARESMETIER